MLEGGPNSCVYASGSMKDIENVCVHICPFNSKTKFREENVRGGSFVLLWSEPDTIPGLKCIYHPVWLKFKFCIKPHF